MKIIKKEKSKITKDIVNGKKALIIVDPQKCFCEGGSLAVPDGDAVIEVMNRILEINSFDVIIITQDWHPANHKSFASNHEGKNIFDVIDLNGVQQTLWPDHGIENTDGVMFHSNLKVPIAQVIRKGTNPEIDSYSGFTNNNQESDTGLNAILAQRSVVEVYILGLATDYCVKFTALDAKNLNYDTTVIIDGCRGVTPETTEIAIQEMKDVGIKIIQSSELLS